MSYDANYSNKEDGRFTNGQPNDADHVKSIYDELGASPGGRLLPSGGTTDQVLVKTDGTDYNVEWAAPASGGDNANFDGFIYIEDMPGPSDSDKLDQAIVIQKADTYARPIMFSQGVYVMDTPVTVDYSGFRITGPAFTPSDQPRGDNPYPTKIQINMSGSWLNWSGTQYACSVSNLSFEGLGGGQAQFAHANPGICYTGTFENLGFSGFKSVFGNYNGGGSTSATHFKMTACVFKGFWNINNTRDTACVLAGSDNTLWTDGCLYDSNTSFQNSPNSYHLICTWLEKTTIGPIYMTAEQCGGILVEGSDNVAGQIVITGARIEGRNSGQPSYGNIIKVTGGGVTFRDCWVAYAMDNPGAGVGGSGVIHQTGGRLLVDGCVYGRGTEPEATPFVYTTGAGCWTRINNVYGNPEETWTGKPIVDAGNNSSVAVVDGFNTSSGLPTGFVQSCDIV